MYEQFERLWKSNSHVIHEINYSFFAGKAVGTERERERKCRHPHPAVPKGREILTEGATGMGGGTRRVTVTPKLAHNTLNDRGQFLDTKMGLCIPGFCFVSCSFLNRVWLTM